MRAPLRTALAAALPVMACGQTMVPSPVPPPQRLAAVTLLPEGSTLNGVMLPRYNAERQLISVLRSDEMRITDSTTIEADAVSVDVYRPDGGRRGRVELGQAIYRQGRETITASKSVRVTSDDLAATGTGAVFYIPTSQGFLLGPVDCRIYAPPEATTMHRPPTVRPHATLAAALLGALQLPVTAAAPAPLSPADLAAIDQAAAPAGGDLAARQADSERLAAASTAAANQADQLLTSFVQSVGLTGVLAEPAPAPTPAPAPEPPPAPAPEPPAAEPPKVEAGPDDTVVLCDGGLFFDGDAGVLVYLDNIRLTNPEFNLNCRDQLKVFLEVKEEKPAAKDAKEAAGNKAAAPATEHPPATKPPKPAKEPGADQLFGGGRFGNLRQIIASGDVRVTRKDAQGRQATATADSAVYDAINGDIILRGGFPTLRQGRDSLVAQQPGLYIRFDKDGNVFAQPGRWKTVAGLRNNKALKPNP